ncbi:MAG: restriction endonuclease subunit S [Betaproteobacteria bacterium]
MSLPSYPEYKGSGAPWMGDIPRTWVTQRVKRIFEIKKRIAGEEGFDILSITQKGIKIKDIESNDGQLSMDYGKYQFVDVGDFAMNHMDLLTGYVDISPYFGVTSPDYRVFSIKDRSLCYDKYFLYLFQNGYRQKIFYAFGQGASQLGRWRFPTEQFNDFILPLPPLAEQTSITKFLDHETAKIDNLIAEQEMLLTLLIEKRQAIISHAVTKGLDSDVPMKDSGVGWLGEIPAHWVVKRLKYLGEAIIGLTYDPSQVCSKEAGVLVLRSSNVQLGKITFDDNVYVSADIPQKLRTIENDILICSRNGSRNLIGKNALISKISEGFTFGAFMTIFRSELNNYLYWIFNSRLFSYQSGTFLTSTINQLTTGNLYSIEVPLPPPTEQRAILYFLNAETSKLDTLTAEATRGIALLKERRSALISAAVTGKIDVRHLVEQEAA